MKKVFIVLILLIPVAGFSQSDLLNRFKQKVKDRAEQRADEGMDKALDKAEEGAKKGASTKTKESKTAVTDAKPSGASTSFESYSRYDFIPGEDIVYAEDFSQDVTGEFPLKWATNNRGEVVSLKGAEGKWLRLYQNGFFVSPYIKGMPENFTAEFDLVLHVNDVELSYVFPAIDVYLLNAASNDEKGRTFFNTQSAPVAMKIAIGPETDDNSTIYLRSEKGGNEIFSNSPKPLTKLGHLYGQPVHFAIWVQKERIRMWMNGEKIYDIPQAVPEKAAFNRIGFGLASSNYDDEKVGYYVSNIKFAQAMPDMRSKLLTEGKLVTSGILFDLNSDKIKPESAGVLQAIAKVLQENASVNVTIIGHTDSDGDDAKNLDLSKRRAASVKRALSTQFGINASRMQTDGKGESVPVSDNNTKEGKAKNRRVEFIKL